LIEQEFYDLEYFSSCGHFLKKAAIYPPGVLKLYSALLEEEFKKSYLSDFNYKVGHHLPVDPGFSCFFA
jgi:hypothetical protein